MGLGSYNTVSLAEARDAARDARRSVLAGMDPITARQEATAQARLATCARHVL